MRKKNQNLSTRFISQAVQQNEKEKTKPFLTSNFKVASTTFFNLYIPLSKEKKKDLLKL